MAIGLEFIPGLGVLELVKYGLTRNWAPIRQPASSSPQFIEKMIAEAVYYRAKERGFARYHSATDPRTQIPTAGLLPYRPQRASPYLYRDAEIEQLLQAAVQLFSPTGLRAQTTVAAFGLLAVTGMRVGEMVGLDDPDVDLTLGQLTIRHGKFGKSRLLPLHPTTQDALRHYVAERDRHYPIPQSPSFLVSD